MAYNRHNKPKEKKTEYSRENVVERAGYISTQKRAENIINAGKNLAEWRKQAYTNEIEQEEPEVNRAAKKNYDFAAFHEDAKELNRRIKAKFSQQKEDEEKKKFETRTKQQTFLEKMGVKAEDWEKGIFPEINNGEAKE